MKWQSNEVFTMDEAQSMELQKGSSHPSASPNANLSATTITIQKWLEKLRKERKKKGYLGDSINGKTNNSSVESCGNQLWCLANNSWVLKVTVCIKQFHHPSNYASLSLSLSLSLWLCAPGTLFFPRLKKKGYTLFCILSIQNSDTCCFLKEKKGSDTCISNIAKSHGPLFFFFFFFKEYFRP